ncbi:hypothetical protein D3C86_1257570 [compost metagenome]
MLQGGARRFAQGVEVQFLRKLSGARRLVHVPDLRALYRYDSHPVLAPTVLQTEGLVFADASQHPRDTGADRRINLTVRQHHRSIHDVLSAHEKDPMVAVGDDTHHPGLEITIDKVRMQFPGELLCLNQPDRPGSLHDGDVRRQPFIRAVRLGVFIEGFQAADFQCGIRHGTDQPIHRPPFGWLGSNRLLAERRIELLLARGTAFYELIHGLQQSAQRERQRAGIASAHARPLPTRPRLRERRPPIVRHASGPGVRRPRRLAGRPCDR